MAEVLKNSLEDFEERFRKLSEEAYSYGIDSAILLSKDSISEGETAFRHMSCGNLYTIIGMV